MIESRVTELESTLVFQERTIQDLSDVIRRQQSEIDRLDARLTLLTERIANSDRGDRVTPDIDQEKPPHY